MKSVSNLFMLFEFLHGFPLVLSFFLVFFHIHETSFLSEMTQQSSFFISRSVLVEGSPQKVLSEFSEIIFPSSSNLLPYFRMSLERFSNPSQIWVGGKYPHQWIPLGDFFQNSFFDFPVCKKASSFTAWDLCGFTPLPQKPSS